MAAGRSEASRALDALLENTVPRPRSVAPPTPAVRRPFGVAFRSWASSQVSAYRVGLVLGYFAMTFFGASAFIAGIPTFKFTTPEGFTPIWAAAVVLGGLIGSIGSLRAGTEPATKEVRVFNGIELTGAILLFITLGTYAIILLIIGYGFYGPPDAGRSSIGAGFIALGVHPTVRMLWLAFRPRFIALNRHRFHHTQTGSMVLLPAGYAIVKTDENGNVIPETPEQTAARLALKEN